MLRSLVGSLAVGEAAVGITLIVLLALGHHENNLTANALVPVGALILVVGFAPRSGSRVIRISSEGLVHAAERLLQTEVLTASGRLRKPIPVATRGIGRLVLGLVAASCAFATAMLF